MSETQVKHNSWYTGFAYEINSNTEKQDKEVF